MAAHYSKHADTPRRGTMPPMSASQHSPWELWRGLISCPTLGTSISQLNMLNDLTEISGALVCSPRGKKNRKKKVAFPHVSIFMTELERAKIACWHPSQWAAGEAEGSNCKREKVSFSHSFLSSKHSHSGHLPIQTPLLGFQIPSPYHTKYLHAAIGFHPHPEKKAHTLAVFE